MTRNDGFIAFVYDLVSTIVLSCRSFAVSRPSKFPRSRTLCLLDQGAGAMSPQLPVNTLRAQSAHLQQGIHHQKVVLVGAEGGRIGLHIEGDHGLSLPEHRLIPSSFKILREQLFKIGVAPDKWRGVVSAAPLQSLVGYAHGCNGVQHQVYRPLRS